ncbi:POT family proton-dependent oligopeptide transporter [Capronia epimyces CBS 606.96]|uniref:POT family proton-dependent oligopeptide transporter n=1 Tax=Capronia epimyces CBS 606.96 TaxID=1182542 RepID=W9YJQ2_9EURO|nr:POT family proton-dependent oligopeptide transporter [Capronia epimyces CBS 606.96]EXJ89466.1 POT family proton-dependent oligopeptide transporter [Capronia epimyces CBS 606.96]
MSSGAANPESAEIAKANVPPVPESLDEKQPQHFHKDETLHTSDSDISADLLVGPNGEQYPTDEELKTLRRTQGHVPMIIYTIGIIECCERFAYYGTIVVFNNYINWPLPEGSKTGAGGTDGQAGALGYGTQAATGLTLFSSFFSYVTPMLGGWLADTYWGRYKTINVAIGLATFGHIIILISAIPGVIEKSTTAMGIFCLGLIFFGMGVGFFKCNISPLVAEQYEMEHPRAVVFTEKSGERVIHDPVMTIARIYMRYYFLINVGALAGQISMIFYLEKYVGFWLAYLLPTILFLFTPAIMIFCRKRYVKRPPTGSVLSKSFHLLGFALKRNWSFNPKKLLNRVRSDAFWESAKPSNVAVKPSWMTFDDAWVDEICRGLSACAVFVFLPIYWLSYSQMTNNLVTQAGTLKLNGLPNDLVQNLDPIALLILIPICDKFVYPLLLRAGIRFTPLKKITAGFGVGSASMVVAALIQHYIYVKSPCGKHATNGDCIAERGPPDLSVWVQTPAYVLIALAEIFTSITGLEYAFTKAPKNMRSFITGLFWFTNAFSSAIGQAFVPLAKDPLFIWLYVIIACLSFVAMFVFWFTFKKLDAEEDALNALPESTYKGRKGSVVDVDVEALRQEQIRQDKIRKAQGLARGSVDVSSK